MRHPGEIQLALLAGDDLGVWERWRVRRHVSKCGECAREIQALEAGRERVRGIAAEMPDGVNWSRLTEEMTGNIRVGLAAGECIAEFEKSPRGKRTRHAGRPSVVRPGGKQGLVSHAALVLACASVIAVVALWVALPKQQTDNLFSSLQRIRFERIGTVVRVAPAKASEVVLETSPLSIGIKENGGALSLLHPRKGVAVSVNMQGSAGARYIDADTDQVTTNRVYYAQ